MAPGKKGTINASDDELEEAVALFEAAAVFGGVLVFLGVAAEVGLLIWPADNERLAGVLASAFVAIGVGIEVLFAKMASRRQGVLLQRSKERLAQVEFENGFTQEQLGVALERAAQAELETERLRVEYGWRFLSNKVQRALKQELSTCRGSVNIMYLAGDADSMSLARQFRLVFEASGWLTALISTVSGSIDFGITISDKDDKRFLRDPALEAMDAALTAADLPFKRQYMPPIPAADGKSLGIPSTRMVIGPKLMAWAREPDKSI